MKNGIKTLAMWLIIGIIFMVVLVTIVDSGDSKLSYSDLLVKIENQCKPNLKFDETDYGIGISSVIAVTNSYEGMYDFIVKNEKFISKICLNF